MPHCCPCLFSICLIRNYSTNYGAVSPIWQEGLDFCPPCGEGSRETAKCLAVSNIWIMLCVDCFWDRVLHIERTQ